jgi:hypothetical protein
MALFHELNTQMAGRDLQKSRIPLKKNPVRKNKIPENEQEKNNKQKKKDKVLPGIKPIPFH